MTSTSETVESLILDLLEWVDARERIGGTSFVRVTEQGRALLSKRRASWHHVPPAILSPAPYTLCGRL